MRVVLIQGANMEYLGIREPEFYGTTTAAELDALLSEEAGKRGMILDIRYTNVEGEAISMIYDADRGDADGLIMNPAGFTYAGYALRDCIKAISMPCVEVHMTNLTRRGSRSIIAEASAGVIFGFGILSYVLGLSAMEMLLVTDDSRRP